MTKECKFAKHHPVVLVLYFLTMIGLPVVSMNFMFITISFMCAVFLVVGEKGFVVLKQILWVFFPVAGFTCLIQPLFSHNGVTPLFYINSQPVTLESVRYGFLLAQLVCVVFIWFVLWNTWISTDAFLYLFHWPFPKIALLISMVLRMMPQFSYRFKQIEAAFRGMGRDTRKEKFVGKIKIYIAELSALLSWSLESGMDTSDSMEARGYGIGRRSTFHLFRFTGKDIRVTVIVLLVLSFGIYCMTTGVYKTYYFPMYEKPKVNLLYCVGMGFYCLGALLPVWKWRKI